MRKGLLPRKRNSNEIGDIFCLFTTLMVICYHNDRPLSKSLCNKNTIKCELT